MLRPPLDVVLECAGLCAGIEAGHIGHVALVESEAVVDDVAERLLVLFGDAEQHADGTHGHLCSQVGDEVERPRSHQRVQGAGAELAHLGLDEVHLAGREDPGEQAAVNVVAGRILEDDGPGRDLHVALDQLEQRPLGRAVRSPVPQAALDVTKATQGVEVVALVVVHGTIAAKPPPYRVRIGVDLEVEGVVVDVRIGRGHLHSLGWHWQIGYAWLLSGRQERKWLLLQTKNYILTPSHRAASVRLMTSAMSGDVPEATVLS